MTMDKAFLAAYSLRLIDTCHRRGAHAMGGMAAQIRSRTIRPANDAAFAKVRADKEREVAMAMTAPVVAHPALVGVAMEAFAAMPVQPARSPDRRYTDPRGDARIHPGIRTEAGARENIRVACNISPPGLGARRGAAL